MKAKDLRGKNIEEFDDKASDESEGEVDAVTAAYENISKKLDSIRSGKSDDSDDSKESEESEEPELEEWKGPKPPEKKSDVMLEVEDEHELRKVKLHNLEDPEEESDEPEDSKESDGREDEVGMKSKKEWEPSENDPLDDEDEEEEAKETDGSDESLESKESEDEEETAFEATKKERDPEEVESFDQKDPLESEMPEKVVKFDRPEPSEEGPGSPDTLDDLTENQIPARQSRDLEDEDYEIPSLKGSGQRGGNLSYNTHPEREGIGQSYSPKGNYMEGNDPNNFFSSHQQPQPPKRANKFHLLILVLIGIAVIGFTVYVLKGGFGDLNLGTTEPSPSPSATATPEPTPTPTPEPTVERGDFTVRVLNGTTTSGLAGKVRDKLKELGYKTATPGNNSDTDIAQTEIRVKEGTESAALLQRLIADLAPDYEAKEGKELDSKSANDAEVIIGAK